jgi:hypothetical protein
MHDDTGHARDVNAYDWLRMALLCINLKTPVCYSIVQPHKIVLGTQA